MTPGIALAVLAARGVLPCGRCGFRRGRDAPGLPDPPAWTAVAAIIPRVTRPGALPRRCAAC